MLHVFQSLLWQVCLLFHAILLQQGCPIAGATATGHGGRGWGRQRGPRQGRWSLSILELRTISSFSTWSPPSSGLGHRCRRRTKGQPGPSPGGGHRVRIAGRHPTAILAGPFALANLRLTYLKSSSFPSFFHFSDPQLHFGREEFNHHLSRAHWYHTEFYFTFLFAANTNTIGSSSHLCCG